MTFQVFSKTTGFISHLLKISKLFIFVLFCYQQTAYSKAWDITEEMMQEMEKGMPKFATEILEKAPCAKDVKSYRYKKEKGLVIEITLKKPCCNKVKISQISKALIGSFKSKPTWQGLTHWLQRGFFYYYVYKDQSGKIISEFRLDREAFIGKQFSKLLETEENSKDVKIELENSTLAFSPDDIDIYKKWAPGLPITQKYGKWSLPQERYIFMNDAYSISLSIISLNNLVPEIEQLKSVNDGDFALQQKPISPVVKINKIERLHGKTQNLFTPVYHIVETIDKKEKATFAYSSLIGNHLALYIVLSGPNSEDTKSKVDKILNSVKFEPKIQHSLMH